MDVQTRLQDHGQLRLAFGNVLDDLTLARLVRSTLEVCDAEWTESSVALQSELWRLSLVFLIDHSRV